MAGTDRREEPSRLKKAVRKIARHKAVAVVAICVIASFFYRFDKFTDRNIIVSVVIIVLINMVLMIDITGKG